MEVENALVCGFCVFLVGARMNLFVNELPKLLLLFFLSLFPILFACEEEAEEEEGEEDEEGGETPNLRAKRENIL